MGSSHTVPSYLPALVDTLLHPSSDAHSETELSFLQLTSCLSHSKDPFWPAIWPLLRSNSHLVSAPWCSMYSFSAFSCSWLFQGLLLSLSCRCIGNGPGSPLRKGRWPDWLLASYVLKGLSMTPLILNSNRREFSHSVLKSQARLHSQRCK